ncbi:MAG: protein O-mannosyl-transferase family [Chitinophagales bacterium]
MNGIASYKRLNNILGWIVFAVALVTYMLTMEKTGSFWDCGEFIAGAYKLQVVHPPGAPVFILIGRVFSLFAFNDVTKIGLMVNFLSAISTAFVALFCFWSTTAVVRKFLLQKAEEYTKGNILATLGSGLVAGLTCTFLDSLWFSATEGEVYALSMFFMTFVVWAIMKWDADDSPRADRWLVLIAFMIGLSTGVHLLSMLVIPFAAIIIYFKKFKPTVFGFLAAFGLSFLVVGFIMKGIISGIPAIYAEVDLLFVNNIGLPFNSGVWTMTAIIALGLLAAVFFSAQSGKQYLHTISMSILVLVIGYSSFMIVPIRSTANTPINMNRPSDPFTMLSYLNREQYGERPLLKGPAYNVDQYDMVKEGSQIKKVGMTDKYAKGDDEYEIVGEKFDYTFEEKDLMLFPRLGVWQDAAKLDGYRTWLQPDFYVYDKYKGEKVSSVFKNDELYMAQQAMEIYNTQNAEDVGPYGASRYRIKDALTMSDNLSYFFNYQIGYMYMRYFMWNFSGKQNDVQGTYANSEGGWITGINAIDDNTTLWGNPSWRQADLSPVRAGNMANNKFYMIPFLLGLLGIFFLFKTNWRLGVALMVMFLTTGVIFIIYSNQPPIEPRERDYTLVGSFFAYAMFIGMSVMGFYTMLRDKVDGKLVAVGATLICLVAPFLMGTQGWDDHNRGGRSTSIDFATNYLESCEQNAIIFTQGDNDTYPLWYAQEVEEVRTDIRIVNLSLLGVDWYINQLRYKMNDANPIKMTFTPEMIKSDNRNYVRHMANPNLDASKYYDAAEVMKFVAKDDPSVEQQIGDPYYMPTKKLSIPVSSAAVDSLNMVNPTDTNINVLPQLQVNLRSGSLAKNDLLTVDIIANNINERPIYFAISVSPSAYLGFQDYFQHEGLTYRVVPVINPSGEPTGSPVRSDIMYENLMNDFSYGQIAENENIYLDENILRMTMNLVSNHARLAKQLLNEGETAKAIEVADKCFEVLPTEKIHYNFFHSDFVRIYLQAGEMEKATALKDDIISYCKAELDYYALVYQDEKSNAINSGSTAYLEQLQQGAFTQNRDIQELFYLLDQAKRAYQNYDTAVVSELDEILTTYQGKMSGV